MLLQTAALLSSGGSQIDRDLLSAARACTHRFARQGRDRRVRADSSPSALFALPAGLAADRWNRKRLMIAAHAVRAARHRKPCRPDPRRRDRLLGDPARRVRRGLRRRRLRVLRRPGRCGPSCRGASCPAAVAAVTGREAAICLAGPPLGGALFGLARALPFLVRHDLVCVLDALRSSRCGRRSRRNASATARSLRSRLAEGFRFLWDHSVPAHVRLPLRAHELHRARAYFSRFVVIGKDRGSRAARSACSFPPSARACLLGPFLSPFVRRALPVRAVLLLELWTWVGCAALPHLAERLRADGEHPPRPRSRSRRPTRSSTATSSR